MMWRDAAVDDIVARSMVARIATISRNGRPHVNPLYFVVEHDHVHLGTATYTLAAHNVRANSQVQVLFEIESAPADRRLVRMDGRATVRTEPELLRRYRNRVARKYMATPAGLANLASHPREWRPMRRHLQGGAACVIDLEATSVELISQPASGAARR